jgi:hypothetical protein
MIMDYGEGGLKILDLESFNKSLKVVWVKQFRQLKSRKMENLFRYGI